jgi:hypothetical protein
LENQFSSGWDTEGLRPAGCPRRRCEKWKMGSSSIKGFINIFTNLRLHSLTPPFIGHCLLPLHITTLSPDNYSTFPEYTYDNTSCPGQFGYLLRSTASACWAVTASSSADHNPVPPSCWRSSGPQNLRLGGFLRRDLRVDAWTAASTCSARAFAFGCARAPSPRAEAPVFFLCTLLTRFVNH